MKEFDLKVVRNGGTLYDGPCASLIIPTTDGFYGIQANHTPLVAAISSGKIKYTVDNNENYISTDGAVLSFENNSATIITK
jgi:F-type H+-transporting ATPase subunit epsilon